MPVGTSATITSGRAQPLSASTSAHSDAVRKSVTAIRSASTATSPSLVKQTQKPFLLTLTTVATQTSGHIYPITLSTIAHAGSGSRTATLTASSATVATLLTSKTLNRTLASTQSQTPVTLKQAGKTITVGTQLALPPLFNGASPIAALATSIVRVIAKTLTASQTQAGSVRKAAARSLSISQAQTATIQKTGQPTLSASSATSPTITALRSLFLTLAQAQAPTVSKAVAYKFAAAVVIAQTMTKTAGRTLINQLNELASLAAQKLAKLKTLSPTQGQTETVTRSSAVTETATQDQAASYTATVGTSKTAASGTGATLAGRQTKSIRAAAIVTVSRSVRAVTVTMRATTAAIVNLIGMGPAVTPVNDGTSTDSHKNPRGRSTIKTGASRSRSRLGDK
jgi:hypothetical protein